MKISVTFQNDVLEIQKKGDGLQAEIWQKKLEDFEFKKNISTGMTVENKKLRKILFWKPIEDNILMVYTRTGEIKACYAPSRGAYLRVLERICNVQHISLTKAGLSLQLQVGVVSDKELSFGEAALVIGERIRQPFDMPVSSRSLDKVKKDDSFFIRKFHFDLDELTREMEETSSRFDIAIKINGLDVTFPVKIEVPDEIEKYQHVPMISFFHKDHAVQIKHTLVGNVLFVCRPMEEVEKTRSFRFWESEPVSGWLYRRGRSVFASLKRDCPRTACAIFAWPLRSALGWRRCSLEAMQKAGNMPLQARRTSGRWEKRSTRRLLAAAVERPRWSKGRCRGRARRSNRLFCIRRFDQ